MKLLSGSAKLWLLTSMAVLLSSCLQSPTKSLNVKSFSLGTGAINSGNLGDWITNTIALPNALDQHSVIAVDDYLYVVGGTLAGGVCGIANVYYANINADGSIGTFTATSGLSIARHRHGLVSANGHLYVIGGNACGGPQSTVQRAEINNDGSLGAWVQGFNLPVGRRRHTSHYYNDWIYVIGGSNPGHATVYRAPANADGTLGAWVLDAESLPGARYYHSGAMWSNYIYVLGGHNELGVLQDTIFYAKVLADGSTTAWQTNSIELPVPSGGHSSVIINDNIYIFGGDLGLDVYYASIDTTNGSIGSWKLNPTDFPDTRTYLSSIYYNGLIYAIGGIADTADINSRKDTIFYSTIDD